MADLILGIIVLLTLGLVVTVFYTLIIRVPFIPTPRHIAKAMIELVLWKGDEILIDLGAGDGSLLVAAKKAHPNITAIGVEIVPTVWGYGFVRLCVMRSGVQLKLGSLFNQDVSKADVVFLYLFPELMEKIAKKFDAELRPGTWVVAQTFGFKGKRAEREIRLPRLGSMVSVYLYKW